MILRSLSNAPVEIVASAWTLFSSGHTGPSRHSFVETTDEFSQEAKSERERERLVNKSF